jgi:hypothetical protein
VRLFIGFSSLLVSATFAVSGCSKSNTVVEATAKKTVATAQPETSGAAPLKSTLGVTPYFECTLKYEGVYAAFFGFEIAKQPDGTFPKEIVIPHGPLNRLDRTFPDETPPDRFITPNLDPTNPGRTTPDSVGTKAFVIHDWDGVPFTWTLDGQSVTADKTKTCQYDTYTDNDGIRPDNDSDGVPDFVEFQIGSSSNSTDSDNDGLTDLFEANHMPFLSPAAVDSDKDGIPDTSEDEDEDGLTTTEESAFGSSDLNEDTDSDLVTDKEERTAGSNPTKEDTDSDGLDDATEKKFGLNPNAADSDSDGNPRP